MVQQSLVEHLLCEAGIAKLHKKGHRRERYMTSRTDPDQPGIHPTRSQNDFSPSLAALELS